MRGFELDYKDFKRQTFLLMNVKWFDTDEWTVQKSDFTVISMKVLSSYPRFPFTVATVQYVLDL